MKLLLTLCTHEDLDELVELSRTTFVHAFEDQNNPEDFKAYLQKAFSKEVLASELNNIHSSFYFVYYNSALAGYFKLNRGSAQTEIQDLHSTEIERIYVHRDYQGKGIGQWMMERIKEIGVDQNSTYIWLGVWEKNRDAIRFYEAHGFGKFGEHPYYVGKDKQTDWLMKCDITTLRE